MELVTRPSVLVLDEPTSGLDSTSALNVVKLLRIIAEEQNVAVIVSIHQPNWVTFINFHTIYMMTRFGGKVLYEERPDRVPQHLHNFQIEFGKESNPADILMEVACGCFGKDVVEDMNKLHVRKHQQNIVQSGLKFQKHPTLAATIKSDRNNFRARTIGLCWRHILLNFRDLHLLLFRVLASLFLIFFNTIINDKAGKASGCPPDPFNMTTLDPDDMDSGFLERFNAMEAKSMEGIMKLQTLFFYVVAGQLFFGFLPVMMTFPADIPVLEKECFNSWYTVTEYYLGKFLAEAPFVLFMTCIFVVPEYYIGHFPTDKFLRFCLFFLFLFFGNFVAQAFAYMMLSFHPPTALHITISIFTFMVMLSGYLVNGRDMDPAVYFLSFVDPFKLTFDGITIAIFGFDRCGDHPKPLQLINRIHQAIVMSIFSMRNQMVDELTALDPSYTDDTSDEQLMQLAEVIAHSKLDKYISRSGHVTSSIKSQKDLEDSDLGPIILFLVIQFLIFRAIAYIMIRSMVNRTK